MKKKLNKKEKQMQQALGTLPDIKISYPIFQFFKIFGELIAKVFKIFGKDMRMRHINLCTLLAFPGYLVLQGWAFTNILTPDRPNILFSYCIILSLYLMLIFCFICNHITVDEDNEKDMQQLLHAQIRGIMHTGIYLISFLI